MAKQADFTAAKAWIGEFVACHGWPSRTPLSIGHRGASAHASENTLEAFRIAAELGADMWELDARVSRDGIVLVSHDDEVVVADGSRIVLGACDATDITCLPLARGGSVPTLLQVIELAVASRCGLYIEIKERGAVQPTLSLLSASGVAFAAVGSFDHDIVRNLTADAHRFPVAVLVRIGEDPFACAAATGAEIIHLCWERASDAPDRLVTPELLARAARERLAVVIWHEERRDVLDRLVRLPVLGICSDAPELLRPRLP